MNIDVGKKTVLPRLTAVLGLLLSLVLRPLPEICNAAESGAASTVIAAAGSAVNLRSFGAVGDGKTDDAPALQAAIDNVGIGVVFVPRPAVSYRLDSTIRLRKATSLIGLGYSYDSETFHFYGKGPAFLGEDYNGLYEVLIQDIRIVNKSGASSTHGIQVINPTNSRLVRVGVSGFVNGSGIRFEASPTYLQGAYFNKIVQPLLTGNRIGISLYDSKLTGVNVNQIEGGSITGGKGMTHGIYIDSSKSGTTRLAIRDTDIESSNDAMRAGIEVKGNVMSSLFEGIGMELEGGVPHFRFTASGPRIPTNNIILGGIFMANSGSSTDSTYTQYVNIVDEGVNNMVWRESLSHNRLPNSSFERWTESGPVGWVVHSTGKTPADYVVAQHHSVVHSGASSLKIEVKSGHDAYVFRRMEGEELRPLRGRKVILRGWVKHVPGDNNMKRFVPYFSDSNGSEGIRIWPSPGRWGRFSVEHFVGENVTFLDVWLKLSADRGPSVAYVDDLFMTVSDEYSPSPPSESPANVLLRFGGKYHVYGTSPPTAGNWEVGDIVWNSGGNDILLWKNVARGSPGKWQAVRIPYRLTPKASKAECETGAIVFDDMYLYVCVSANAWRRAPLEMW